MTMTIVIWRHPRPRTRSLAGRCIGQADPAADPRKARRLARRIGRWARCSGWPDRAIWTSPLARAAIVGRLLRRRGWHHHVDHRLAEVDFGRWDGLRWDDVPVAEIDAWSRDLRHYRPGGGESLEMLAARVRAFCGDHRQGGILVVGHGGWIRLALALADGEALDAGNWGDRRLAHGHRATLDPSAIDDLPASPGPDRIGIESDRHRPCR